MFNLLISFFLYDVVIKILIYIVPMYFRRSCQGGFFLPLSGGVDSSSSACIVYSMCEMIIESVSKGGKICTPSSLNLRKFKEIMFCRYTGFSRY